jgi:DNA gyrase/topoisomerase IV subunit B
VEEFKVLSDREHVLQRVGVYLGSATIEESVGIIDYIQTSKMVVPALIKMIEEPLQNSVDEFIRTEGKFATKINISFVDTISGTEITISDNGRGIPVDLIDGKPKAVHAWTSLRAGSNFDDTKRIGAGTNGMGVALTCIFSTSFKGITCTGKDRLTLTSLDNMSTISWTQSKTSLKGTTVSFIPDVARFGLSEFTQDHMDVIVDRILNLAIVYPGIEFQVNAVPVKFKNIKEIGKRFDPSAVTFECKNIALVFGPSGQKEEFLGHSYVNGIFIKNGGSHVDFILSKIIENLRDHIKKKFKIDVLPNQIKQHLLVGSWISGFPALRFDSQSKERVTNSVGEVSAHLAGIDFDKISKQILNTPEILDPMIAAILYKKEMAEKLALSKKLKAGAKVRVVNHIAATDPDPENRMLLIVEGLSALGSLIAVRDSKTTGGFPLKGKVLNIRDMKPIEILKNKEIFELLNILGLEIGKEPTDLNYGKIVVFTDSDKDGSAIYGLLLNLFSIWPKLFDDSRIYRMLAPLYFCTKGKQTKIFYTQSEFDKVDTKGWEVSYFKGLGSMPENVYSECVNNPRLVQVVPDKLEYLEMAFGGDASLRKTWMTK